MSRKSSKTRDRKCRNCFQYNPVHAAVCRYCGIALPKTRAHLSLWEKLKRLLGM